MNRAVTNSVTSILCKSSSHLELSAWPLALALLHWWFLCKYDYIHHQPTFTGPMIVKGFQLMSPSYKTKRCRSSWFGSGFHFIFFIFFLCFYIHILRELPSMSFVLFQFLCQFKVDPHSQRISSSFILSTRALLVQLTPGPDYNCFNFNDPIASTQTYCMYTHTYTHLHHQKHNVIYQHWFIPCLSMC